MGFRSQRLFFTGGSAAFWGAVKAQWFVLRDVCSADLL